jgi:hypothetical protein
MINEFIKKNIWDAGNATDKKEKVMTKKDVEKLSLVSHIQGQLDFLYRHRKKFNRQEYEGCEFELKKKLFILTEKPQT